MEMTLIPAPAIGTPTDSRFCGDARPAPAAASAAPDRRTLIGDCRDCYLDRLGWLLRSGGALSDAARQIVLAGVGEHFDAMIDNPQRGSFSEEAHGLTSSCISLISDDELELGILLDHLASRLFEGSSAAALWKIQRHFTLLLNRPDLQPADNPVGLRGIGEGLRAMFAAADISSLEQKQNLVDRLEDLLREGLPLVYGEVADFLNQAGIDASPPGIASSPENLPNTREKALETLQQSLLIHAPASAATADIYTGARLLSPAALENLLFRLDAFEQASSSNGDFRHGSAIALESLLPGLFSDQPPVNTPPRPLNSIELRVPPGTAEALAIDSMVMICTAIADAPELPEFLKTLIVSLKVSLVRVAIKDASLLTKADHPCRRFINGLGRAAVGLPADAPAQHPVYQRLAAIVSELREDRAGNAASYADACQQLEAAIAAHDAAIDQAAAAYETLFAQLDRRDEADREVNALFARLGVEREPAEIRSFLERNWRHLLEQIWLHDDGECGGPLWQEQVQALETLLWSFQPKRRATDRERMAQALPAMLQVLNSGMARLNMQPADQKRILDAFFVRQHEALRRIDTDADAAPAAAIPARRPLPPVTTDTLKDGERVLHTLDLAAADLTPPARLPCQPGDWLELSVAGRRCALRACRQSPRSGRTLLFNPDIDLALAIHPQLLKEELSAGEAIRLGQIALFEAAASQAVRDNTP
ncbi:MAG: DUF1631 domain-containing protein [Azonexus sp.]|nr:DUF1631 domain-containing protein [Azonexus sp.]